jgi:hypothetical protein
MRERLHIEVNEQDGIRFLGKSQKKYTAKWMEDLLVFLVVHVFHLAFDDIYLI